MSTSLLNVVKTRSLLIASNIKQTHFFVESNEKLALEIIGKDIEATHIKCLGIYIDHTLNWKKEIKFVTTKASRALGILNYSKHLCQFETLKTLCTSIIEPHFRYCCSVWGVVRKLKLTDCKYCKIQRPTS